MANYNVSKQTFGSSLQLDPVIAAALSKVIRGDSDGDRFTVSVTEPLSTSSLGSSNVPRGTDVITFDFDSGTPNINLGSLSSTTRGALNAIIFNRDGNDPNTTLDLSSFRGTVILGDGDDVVTGSGQVAIDGGAGNDSITTGSNGDTIVGGLGNDTIKSGGGADLIKGGEGNDSVDAGSGNDTIFAGGGADTIIGGEGNDRIIVEPTVSGTSVINGGSGHSDILDLFSLGDTIDSAGLNGSTLQITLDGGAILNVTNVERFIYDSNGAAPGGAITVGLSQFLADPDF
jgi:Ca2+-binding RTX toxin-like protein